MKTFSIFLFLATLALEAVGQGGSTGGGWYVINESLQCTSICEPTQGCHIVALPSNDDIARFCKQITDDCADGVLSNGSRSSRWGVNGNLGTTEFGSGSGHGNNGCPNLNQCNLSFNYLVRNMRSQSAPGRPNVDCKNARIDINGYYNHKKTGAITVGLSNVRLPPA